MDNYNYNGWHNYETWLMNLWITNDQGTIEYWESRAAELLKSCSGDKKEAIYLLYKEMSDEYEEILYNSMDEANISHTWIMDITNAGFQEIDFYEIAESIMEF